VVVFVPPLDILEPTAAYLESSGFVPI